MNEQMKYIQEVSSSQPRAAETQDFFETFLKFESLFLLQGLFNRLVSLTEEARKAYKDMVSALEQEQAEEALKNDKKVPHHMGHSRNHSAASAISFCSIFSEPISEVNEKEYGKLTHFWLSALHLCHRFLGFSVISIQSSILMHQCVRSILLWLILCFT